MRLAVERGLRLDVAFGRSAAELAPEDRRFVHELTYGTTRLRGRLDHLLAARVDRGLERVDSRLLEILRMGAYQLFHMEGVPAYAAISQSVELAIVEEGRRPAGLVNAVLRAVAEAGNGLERFPDPELDPVGFLTTWGSHPEWLVRRWLGRWPFEDVRALVEADNTPPELVLVPLEATAGSAAERLTEAGIESRPVGPDLPVLRLAKGSDPRRALEALPVAVIQDPAAYRVARYVDPPAGARLADLCAAPGGKLLVIAGRVAYSVAADRSELRMRMVRENVERTGLPVGLVVADARKPALAPVEVVLLDVPCTGTGTLRRHPDGRWRLGPDSPARFARIQSELLESAAEVVAAGGLLVYATCSLEPEENRDLVSAFLDVHPEFALEPGGAAGSEHVDASGFLEVLPQTSGFDGAFAARLRRAA